MPDAPDNPQFDNLVRVIETLQRRIRSDRATIRGSEIRTRTALIDPLLYALGWDAANPALVVPDYPPVPAPPPTRSIACEPSGAPRRWRAAASCAALRATGLVRANVVVAGRDIRR